MAGADSDPTGPPRASSTVVAVVAVAVLLLGLGGLYALGVGPLGGPTNATGSAGPTGAPVAGGSTNGSGPGPGHVRPFSMTIDKIETCGRTCRDVTVTLTNNGGHARENVTVETTMYAGQDAVWQGEASVGTLGAHASRTQTRHVDVGLVGGAKIQQNGGVVTIVTDVHWTGGSARFTERRKVA